MFHVNITLVLKNIHALRDIYDLRLHYFAQYCCCIPVYTYLAWSGTPALLQTQKRSGVCAPAHQSGHYTRHYFSFSLLSLSLRTLLFSQKGLSYGSEIWHGLLIHKNIRIPPPFPHNMVHFHWGLIWYISMGV